MNYSKQCATEFGQVAVAIVSAQLVYFELQSMDCSLDPVTCVAGMPKHQGNDKLFT